MYFKNQLTLDPKNPPYVPNELIVIFNEKTQSKISGSIPVGANAKFHLNETTNTGVSNIDSFLKKNNCTAVSKIHGLIADNRMNLSSSAKESVAALSGSYRIRFDKKKTKDIKKICTNFSKLNGVKDASLNFLNFTMEMTPNDPYYSQQWGLTAMKLPEAWNCDTGNPSVKVAVVDSGADLNHPDLVDNLITGRDLIDLSASGLNNGDVIDINGQNWMIEDDVAVVDNSPGDRTGHGTHVAGTIGAVSDNNTGVTGVAWGCSIMPVKGLFRVRRLSDNRVTGVGTDADVAAAITWAANNGAHIINMSLGGPSSPTKLNAINFAISQDCLCIAAMGNDNSSAPSYPAAYPGVMAVGAIDNTNSRATFSNRGPHISVVAPGVNIRSTYWDDTYANLDGTSMATPHVAGLAALLKSADSSLTASQIIDIIEQTATALRDNPSDPVPNDNYGHGLVNAEAALLRVCEKPSKPWLDPITRFPEIISKPWKDPITRFPEGIKKPWFDPIKKPYEDPITRLPEGIKKPWLEPSTDPRIDHRKRVELDKRPGIDSIDPGLGQPAPFVLSTPHHYEKAYEEYSNGSQDIEYIFEEARKANERGELTQEDVMMLDMLYQRYYGA